MYNKTVIIGRVKGKEAEALHRIYAFKGSAKLVEEYVQDGMLVCVEGALTDARSAIIAERIVFLSPAKKREPEPDEKN